MEKAETLRQREEAAFLEAFLDILSFLYISDRAGPFVESLDLPTLMN